MKHIKYSTKFSINYIEILYTLSSVKDWIMMKVMGIVVYKDKERIDWKSKMKIRCGKIRKYTSNRLCKGVVCKD